MRMTGGDTTHGSTRMTSAQNWRDLVTRELPTPPITTALLLFALNPSFLAIFCSITSSDSINTLLLPLHCEACEDDHLEVLFSQPKKCQRRLGWEHGVNRTTWCGPKWDYLAIECHRKHAAGSVHDGDRLVTGEDFVSLGPYHGRAHKQSGATFKYLLKFIFQPEPGPLATSKLKGRSKTHRSVQKHFSLDFPFPDWRIGAMIGISLKCGDYDALLKSVEDAQGHAELTSHSNFSESIEAVLNLVCSSCE
ncbi:hypothetical protein NL676_031263 [Syzygium grande]|nr:hypothetical protein NL676_031263 [Syzygium grande]